MLPTRIRLGLVAVALTAVVLAAAPRQHLRADTAPKPQLISDMPPLKAGDKVKVVSVEIKTITTDEGMQDVTEIVEPVGGGAEVVIPSAHWQLDVDGWFDADGLNLTAIYPRSGLWNMRRRSGDLLPRPEEKKKDQDEAGFPIRPLPVFPEIGDMISHVNGVAVTSYPALVYAVNSTKNKRDVPVVHVSGRTGKKRLMYVTCHKDPMR